MALPSNIYERIQCDAYNSTKKMKAEKRGASYCLGYEAGYNEGATAEAELAQNLAEVLDNIGNGPFPITQNELEEWLLKTKSMAREALKQWNTGKEVER